MDKLSTLLAFVRRIYPLPMDSPHKGSVMWSFSVFVDVTGNNMLKKKTVEMPVIWDATMQAWRHCTALWVISRYSARLQICFPFGHFKISIYWPCGIIQNTQWAIDPPHKGYLSIYIHALHLYRRPIYSYRFCGGIRVPTGQLSELYLYAIIAHKD